MNVVVTLIHPVDDFDRWKTAVLERIDPLLSEHVIARTVYRSVDEPNEVLVQVVFASAEQAAAHLSQELADELDATGVEVYPPAFAGVEVPELRIGHLDAGTG